MKKKTVMFLTLALILGLTGCAKQSPENDAEPQNESETQEESWRYRLSSETSETNYRSDDGTVVATVSYEQPLLILVNETGEQFSGDTPERGVTAEQLAVCRTFNDATAYPSSLSGAEGENIDWEELGRENYEWSKEIGLDMRPVSYELRMTDSNQYGDLLSVCAVTYRNLGGAHPTNGLLSWNYDTATGTFVELGSLTDRPSELTRTLVDEITAQINASEEREGYFEDWHDTLSQTTDFDVFYGAENLTVFFSEDTLGPHALGVPIFEIPYDMLAEFLNDYGRQLLPLS